MKDDLDMVRNQRVEMKRVKKRKKILNPKIETSLEKNARKQKLY